MYNEEQVTENENSLTAKRKAEEIPRSSRRKLLRGKIQRTVPESEKFQEYEASTVGDMDHGMLVNPQSSKIPSSHSALEQASQSEIPEAAYYPSPQGHNFMIGMPMGEALPGAPEFIPLGSPQLPPMDGTDEDLESHQYQEIMQMLLQAIHNQNRIMEECRNILSSIHHAITPTPAQVPQPQAPPPPPPPPQPQQPQPVQATYSVPPAVTLATPVSQPAQVIHLWNPKNDSPHAEDLQPQAPVLQTQQMQQQKAVEPQPKPVTHQPPSVAKVQSSSSQSKKQLIKAEPKEAPKQSAAVQSVPPPPAPQPPLLNLQSVSSSKEPDKPTVYGPDGEFSSAYLRYVYSKSSTATSFANVLMKEVFNLEERISSNCNGVMGKKALEAERLDKIKRAVKRFYTDTEEEFQDLWKKCRKSIDSTNRNLKFVIMKKPTL